VEAHSQGFQKQKTLTIKSGFCTRGGPEASGLRPHGVSNNFSE
jgi:hypothetical protein